MITLVQFPRGMGVPNPSPFCMKAEIMLKMAEQQYEIEELIDPRKSPKSKLPYIRDNGAEIADSSLIQQHLEQSYAADFFPDCNKAQEATGHAIARMCEERLYQVIVYSRWIDENNWSTIRQFWFGSLPPIIRNIVPSIAQKGVVKAQQGHGIGRHSGKEIYAMGCKDIQALADILGEQPYILGDNPTAADATAYSHIENCLVDDIPSPLLNEAQRHENLVAYRDRCRALWFADLEGDS